MKIKKCIGGLAAVALVMALCTATWAAQKELTIRVSRDTSFDPPTACNISCSPGNLRSSNALMTTTWNSTGADYVILEANTPGGVEDHYASDSDKGPANGSHSHQYSYSWGYYYYTAHCKKNSGVEATSTCYSLLSCFVKGTKVLLCNGKEAPIEEIPAGTSVKAWDPETKTFTCSTVQKRIETETDKRYKIMTSKGGKELEITPTHRLLVNGVWKDSSEVKVGDLLLYADGTSVKVEKIELITEDVPVYNLITDFPNDFFAESILVHNDNSPADHKDKGMIARTRIMKADGTQVPIDQIKAGDVIMSWDPKTGRWMHNTVRKVHQQTLGKTYRINGNLRMGTAQVMYKAMAPKKAQ